MVELLSNTVDIDRVREDMDYSSAVAFIDSLDDEELTALDSVDFLSGRAAYSPQTLKQLTERIRRGLLFTHGAELVLHERMVNDMKFWETRISFHSFSPKYSHHYAPIGVPP